MRLRSLELGLGWCAEDCCPLPWRRGLRIKTNPGQVALCAKATYVSSAAAYLPVSNHVCTRSEMQLDSLAMVHPRTLVEWLPYLFQSWDSGISLVYSHALAQACARALLTQLPTMARG